MNIGDMIDEEFEDASDEADNEYQFLNEPSGPPSTSNSCTSSPPVNNNSNSNNEEPPASSPQRSFYTSMLSQSGNTLVFSNSGKPYGGAKRGPGRPRKDFLPGNRIVKDGRIIFKKVRAGNIHKFPMKRKPAVSKDEKITSNSGVFGLHHENSTGESNSSGLYSSKSPSSENLPLNANENGTVEGSNSNSGDKTPLQTPEELPYFPERWPGKVCALCNLGERSQLGQGEMLRLEISETDQQILVERSSDEDKEAILNDVSPSSGSFPQISNRRQKGLSKCKNPVITSEYVDELDKIGYTDAMDFASIQESPYYYVHRLCATWSFGVLREPSGALDKIASVIFQSLKRKCSYCNHYGASVACKMSCPKFFHFPCVAASGGFQIIQNFTSFCKEHINQVPLICNTDDINCRSCSSLGDVTNLVMCLVCGDHYHGTCIGLPQLPGVRAGWQCNSCRKCQICRVPDINEGRSLSCEQCHKVFHANCLRPVMSSIPKYGWKCRRCRVCSDCGSRTPGAGASSRWHAHYTVCDSCYQQRNKGFSCPICHRAYRAAAYREMVKCSWCNKFVHSTCDSEADLSVYHEKKQNNPDYDYICPPCKTLIQSGRLSTTAGSSLNRNSNYDEDNISVSQDSNFAEEGDGNTGNSATGIETFEKNSDYGLGKGKPYLAIKVAAKKRMGGLSFSGNIGGGSGIGVGAVGGGRGKGNKVPFQKRIRLSEFGRKRGPKTKIRGVFGIPGLELQRPSGSGTGGNGDASATSNNKDDEPGIENRLVLCSAKDKFILTQDICVMCGAIGTDYEGCLISCTQCGQCYHPYCVNVKVTKIILQKGWRCLDCTVCEGCGQKNDEARLILCDECDISYHIYCMEPPLDYVPQGNWKCKWCAICHKCGKNTPGKNCQWKNNYIECGPCSSQTLCAFCSEQYQEGELIIQCHQCERWLHCKCDSIKNEDEAQKCDNMGYNCILCRPKDQLPPHLLFAQLQQQQGRKTLLNSSSNNSSTSAVANRSGNTPKHQQDDIINDTSSTSISLAAAGLEGSHYVDGICLSENGLNMIKSLQMEYIRRKRKQKFSNNDCISSSGNNKDAGILAAIESVVAGSFSNNEMISDDIMKVVEPLDPKEEAEIYKDGMVWERADASPPEGFALFTNEQGIVVLRKKRQRNLQKLGIGGFNVRNRASFKKDGGSAIFKDASDIAITCDGESGDTGNSGLCFSESYPPSSEKKRKPLRKKQKSKLTETYPSYLQEAFFGKSLLDTSKTNFESDTSEDETKSNVSDDKCIKLSQEELQILDQIKTERQKSLLRQQQQKASSPGITMTQQQLITVGNSDLSDIITTTTASEIMPAPAAVTTTITTPITTTTTALPIAVTAAAVQIQKEQQQLVPSTKPLYNDIKIGGNYTNNLSNVSTGLEGTATPSLVSTAAIAAVESASTQGNSFSTETTSMSAFTPNQLSDDSDAFKDIISNDLLDSDLVNSIINDGDDLSKNSGSLDISCDDTKLLSKKNDLTDILSPHFSLESIGIDSKDVDDIFQDVIDTENKSVQTANHNKPSETPPLSTTSSSMGFAKAGEIAGASLSPTNTFISIHQQQPQQHQFSTSTNTINKAQTMHQTIAATVIASNSNNTFVVSRQNTNSSTLLPTNSIRSVQSVWQQQPQQSNVQNLQQQSNTNIQSVVTTVQQQQQQMNCAQKSSERMRRDEELGEMATISAVLYANTNHPELKQDYPNWNDRCKQIYKRWRALSNEKKAPFLQQARDNRSSLRMRKGQQENIKDGNNSRSTTSTDLSENNDEEDSSSRLSSCSSSIDNDKSSIILDNRNNNDEESNIVLTKKSALITDEKFSSSTTSPLSQSLSLPSPSSSSSTTTPLSSLLTVTTSVQTKLNVTTATTKPKENLLQHSQMDSIVTATLNAVSMPVAVVATTTQTTSQLRRSITSFPTTKYFISSGNFCGPAPNVTVNANGVFNTGTKSGALQTAAAAAYVSPIRHITTNHIILANTNKNLQKFSIDLKSVLNNVQLQQQQQQQQSSRTVFHHGGLSGTVEVTNEKIVKLNTVNPASATTATAELAEINDKKNISTTGGGIATIIHQPTTICLDQNIRVLTPSEIMKTLPMIPDQEIIIPNTVVAAAATVTSPAMTNNNDGDGGGNDSTSNSYSNSSTSSHHINTTSASCIKIMDQEKITTQQKTLKEQEQERQWKQLQAMRAKEQQMQHFNTPMGRDMISSGSSGGSVSSFMDNSIIGGVNEKHSIGLHPTMPGTPRPQFNTDIVQPTVYATSLDKFHTSVNSFNSLLSDNITSNSISTKHQENNKQLRDLLQRQGNNELVECTENGLTSRSSQINKTVAVGGQRWMSETMDTIGNSSAGHHDTMNFNTNTFREPFPVMTTSQQNKNQKLQSISPTNNQNQQPQQQQQTQLISTSHQNPNSPAISIPPSSPSPQILSSTTGRINFEQQQQQRIKRVTVRPIGQTSVITNEMKPNISNVASGGDDRTTDISTAATTIVTNAAVNRQLKIKDDTKTTDGTEIPESVTSDLEKLEQDDNNAIGEVEGVGDILGGLGEDDDDELLNSLTAEMGADFNILEYADPELDALTDSDNHNLFDKLDLDEGDHEDRMKKLSTENKISNIQQRFEIIEKNTQQSSILLNQMVVNQNEVLVRRTEGNTSTEMDQERRSLMKTTGMNLQSINPSSTSNIEGAKIQQTNLFRVGNLPRYCNIVTKPNICKITRPNLPPPPPPYPGPPPPYPSGAVIKSTIATTTRSPKEQPLLLEDLLEQEKREQQQQKLSTIVDNKLSYISNVSGVGGGNTSLPHTKSLVTTNNSKIGVSTPVYNVNLHPPPALPPDNIITEQDRIQQITYEQWLSNQNVALNNQQKFYEDEVAKLRKIRKSLNSKQRLMKKNGSELSTQDALELSKISSEQAVLQKQLEIARKQSRQHALLVQEYKSKHLAKLQMSSSNINSPGKMTPVSPLLSPSTGSQGPPSALMQSSSPLSNHMLQSTRSPLQSPSPLLSHSPGGINQSPIHQPSSNVSPYHTMQSSPRISTPHSLCDENSFSPSAISSSSPLTGRRTSPSPRITSPQQQQRVSSSVTTVTGNNQMTTVRISNSPGHNFANGGHITTTSSNQVQQKFINLNIGSGQDKGRLTVHLQQQLQDNTQQSLLTSANTFSQQQQQQQLQTSESIQQQAHRTTTSMQFLQQQHRQQVVQQRQQGCQTAATSQMLIKQQQQQQRIQSPASLIHSQNSNIATSTFNFNIQQHQFGNRNRVATNIDNNSPLIDNYILLGNTVQQQHRDNTLNSSVSTSTTVVAAADIQKYLGNSQQDQQGSGGGSNNNAHLFPFDGSLLLRNGKIKLGLFGGSPMWNISNLNQKFRNENQIVSRKDKQNSSSETRSEGSNKMIASSSNSSSSSLSSLSKSSSGSIGLMNDIVVVDSSPDEKSQRNHHSLIEFDDYQDNKSFVGAEVSLNSAAQNLTDGDDITVIESFASASASASELCADIISSPLDSEVAEEYVLFSSDVVNYDDSNDSIKTTSLPCSKPPSSVLSTGPDDLKLMKIDCSKDYTDSLSSSPLSSSAKRSTDELLDVLQHESIIATTNSITPTSMESIIATTSAIEKQQQENVTIMTTSTNKELSLSSSSIEKGKSSTSDNQIIIAASVALPVNTTSTVTAGGTTTSAIGTVSAVVTVPRRTISPKTIISNSNFVTTNLLTCNRIPFTSVEMLTAAAANIQTTSSSSTSHSVTVGHATPSTVVVTPKKIVTASGNDVTQTAKVSIGNTTISVPLLKTMTLNSSHIISNSGTGPNSSVCSIGEKQNKVVSSSVSITKQPTILNVRGQKINPGTIVSLSPIQIKPSTVTSNKIVQAAVVGKKIQLPSSQSSSQSTASLETVTSLKPNLIHTYSYPKLSSLTVLQQDISLPNKIFEDESASPDSSLEQDDSDIKETSSSSITTTATISNTISTTVVSKTSNTMTAPTLRKAIESCSSKISDKVSSDDKLIEKSGEPPKKVLIIAATEDKKNEEQHQKISSSFIKTDTTSSTEQKLTEAQTAVTVARSISIMPQLSPLSKPTEMTTNLANVSQQLRTIMSSIHNSSLTSTSQTSSAAAATEVKKSIITELDDPDGTRNNSKELFHNTSKTVLNRSAANEEQKSSSLSDKKTANIATISNSNTLTVFLTTTNASIAPVQKSIELGQQKQKSINTSNSTTTMTPTSTNTIFSSVAQQQSNISTLTSATSSGLSNTSNKSTSTTFSASVISVDNNKRNLLISSPLSSSNQFSLHLKRSKSTDDGGVDRGETPAQITGTKRYSLEVTPLKLESSEDFVHGIGTSSNVATSSTSITTGVIPRSTMDSSTITTTTSSSIGCKTSNLIIGQQVTKPDETQNVLLKKLLQNSGGTPSSGASSANSNSGGVVSLPSGQSSIPLRKVAAVRAPSLGVVSSLEAQLARPVIPPVPASPSSAMLQQATQPAAMKIQSVLQESASTSKINTSTPDDDTTKKSSTQLISRETSFVSSPVVVMNTTMKQQQQQQHETSGGYVNDKQRSSFEKNTVSSTGAFIEVKREKSPPSLSMKLNFTQKINELKRSESLSSHQSSPQSAPLIEKTSSEESSFKMMFCDETTKSLNRQDSMEIPCTPTSRTSTLSGELGDEIESLGGKDEKLLMKSLSSSNNTTTTDSGGVGTGSNYDINAELKKKRKREYQKNRRQMLNKDALHSNAGGGSNSSGGSSSNNKKRSRKLSKLDEDYDNFIDNLMSQLRQMPPLQVLEPLLSRNYSICPPYGAGDLSKFGNKENNSTTNLSSMGTEINNNSNQIKGTYGNIEIDNIFDFYNTKPFGNLEPVPEIDPTPPHNGFYDQEFPPIKFDTDYDSNTRFDIIFKDRDIDTPESIVTSSSPECVQQMTYDGKDHNYHPHYGLKMMKDDYEDDNNCCYDRMSPIVPVVVPTPIKLKVGIDLSLDKKQTLSLSNINDTNQKENLISGGAGDWKNRVGSQNSIMQANDSNVTVTLTLTSSAAEDILGVLRDLANILHIPPPSSYQIVERTTTPTSHKLGLYRTKRKDGKEGDPIDIQTILNGAAKFCRHCDVVILNTIIRAKASEFPLLSNNELINDDDDLYFCSKSCYKQFKWRPTNIIDDDTIMIDKDTKQQQTSSFSNDFNGTKPIFNSNDNNDNHMKKIKQEDFGDDFITGDGDNDLVKLSTNGNKNALKKCVNDLLNSDIGSNGSGGGIKSEISSSPTTTTTAASVVEQHPPKICRYKYYTTNSFNSLVKYKKPSDKEITDMLFRMNITVAPSNKMPDDTRQCIFCNQIGDGVADGPSRLLNFDVDKWVHLNCALWSDGVYETVNGALMNLETALQASLNQTCTLCHQLGATIKCFKNRCINIYHLTCAVKDRCVFYKNKTTHCYTHAPKTEKENELTTLSVQRRVYVERDESRQVAAVMHHSELSNLLRVGSLTFLNVGQLLPHQLQAFHTTNHIYPIGYKIIRFYWSMRRPNKRCRYICSIADVSGRPEFRILVQEPSEEDLELRDITPKAVWQRILEPLATLRKNCDLVQLFPKYVTGEDLFGLTEPAVVRILESLPGIETLTDYRFKYGRNPLLELPLAINPSGAARTEPKQKQAVGWRKSHTQRSGSTNQRLPLAPTTSVAGEVACPYSKQFVHSKSSQYKKMKQEWRNNVYLARSKIQGLGLYAARDLEKHTMVIEYIGEIIRTEVSEIREKQYEARNRGIYMFRLDEDRVIDATLCGGLARYINHSCNPNCVTEIVEVDREYRIIIFAKRRINRGEELSYDYKFDIEDDAHKISCMCGAPNCRKWMN